MTRTKDVEAFHGANERPSEGRAVDLRQRPKLPIVLTVCDFQYERSVLKCDANLVIAGKFHMCFLVSLELRCTADELGESWRVEYRLMEEGYLQVVE
jgi:hypothetical protein